MALSSRTWILLPISLLCVAGELLSSALFAHSSSFSCDRVSLSRFGTSAIPLHRAKSLQLKHCFLFVALPEAYSFPSRVPGVWMKFEDRLMLWLLLEEFTVAQQLTITTLVNVIVENVNATENIFLVKHRLDGSFRTAAMFLFVAFDYLLEDWLRFGQKAMLRFGQKAVLRFGQKAMVEIWSKRNES
ncbi:hypothetical protein Tco_1108428 [Tanacetum coccineum]